MVIISIYTIISTYTYTLQVTYDIPHSTFLGPFVLRSTSVLHHLGYGNSWGRYNTCGYTTKWP